MAFEIPEGLHQDLYPLAWLVGTWRGKGRGEHTKSEAFEFAQEVAFNHDGRNFLNYYSRTWILDNDGEIVKPGSSEVGFWRPRPNNTLEVLLTHSYGVNEGWVGIHDGPKIQLAFDRAYSAPSAPEVSGGHRLYGLVEGELFMAYDMEVPGQELQPHIWSTLERQKD